MAKANKTSSYKYPSRFGSHSSMVVESATNDRSEYDGDADLVVCEDEFGQYETSRTRLDNGLADPNRYLSSRLGRLYEKAVDKK